MAFINAEVQRAFFKIVCTRRIKRVMYGATLYHPMSLAILFDRCLNMILCHHPHIWSYGTGNLLVAPNTPAIFTKAEEQAIEWRKESLNKQDEELSQVIGNSFGYFIRYSIECRARIQSGNKLKQRCLHLVQTLIEHTNSVAQFNADKSVTDEILILHQMFAEIFTKVSFDAPIIDLFWEKSVYDMYLQMFKYVDVHVPQLADLILNIKAVSRKGVFRYGKPFIKGCLTDGRKTREIIIECNRRPIVTILREFMLDILEPENFTSTISSLVIPPSFLYADEKTQCVVCLEKKDVLMWPCHISHVSCTECTIELLSLPISCPLCRQSVIYIYGTWYLDNDDNKWLFILQYFWYEWHRRN
jgi:hypothetical protein